MLNRKAFTLIEVLISIALLGLILVPLFSVVEMMKDSNERLLHSLENSQQITKATKVLFLDIMGSDGNLTLKKDEFSRVCIEETTNSLYGLPLAKVCWLVIKDKNTLVRSEGNAYKLPLKYEDKVEVDTIMSGIEIFDVYREKNKDKVIVVIQQKDKEPISFMVQGIFKPKPPSAGGNLAGFPAGTRMSADGQTIILPDGRRFPVGSTMGENGQVIPPKGSGNNNSNNRSRPKQGQNTGNASANKGRPTRTQVPNTPLRP